MTPPPFPDLGTPQISAHMGTDLIIYKYTKSLLGIQDESAVTSNSATICSGFYFEWISGLCFRVYGDLIALPERRVFSHGQFGVVFSPWDAPGASSSFSMSD